MFEKGKFYNHNNASDLGIFVLVKQEENEKEIKLKVAYVFNSNKRVLCLDFITIQKEDFQYWKEVWYE